MINTQTDFDKRTETFLRQLQDSGQADRIVRDHEPGETLLVVILARSGDLSLRTMPWSVASEFPCSQTSSFYHRLRQYHDAGVLPILLTCPELDLHRTAGFGSPQTMPVPQDLN